MQRLYKVYLAVTVGFTLLGALLTLIFGLNLGIDFTGGTMLERGFSGSVTPVQVEQVLASDELAELDLGNSVVQPVEDSVAGRTLLLIRTKPLDTRQVQQIDTALEKAFGSVESRRTEVVGPVVGRELVSKAIWAMVIASVLITVYVGFRFEYRFGLATIISLLHDVFVTLGAIAVLQREVNSPFVAALLTIIGYSINDTIIIFDRIRENLRNRKRESLGEIVETSVNQTLVRSLLTSITTLLAILALYFFGGSSIKDFTLTLLIGITAGAVSSIFMAAPLWLAWRNLEERRRPKVAAATR